MLWDARYAKDKKKKKVNPWAVCHSQLGPKKTAKFERCVRDVKKSIAEGKDPFEVILENKIISLLGSKLARSIVSNPLSATLLLNNSAIKII